MNPQNISKVQLDLRKKEYMADKGIIISMLLSGLLLFLMNGGPLLRGSGNSQPDLSDQGQFRRFNSIPEPAA
jgi:hypothetical protein